jgi:hypothetical protein
MHRGPAGVLAAGEPLPARTGNLYTSPEHITVLVLVLELELELVLE